MKKIVKVLFVFVLMVLVCAPVLTESVEALEEPQKNVTVETLENGDWIEIIIEEDPIYAVMSRAAAKTKSGSKTVNYYNKENKILWSVVVKGTFSYTGTFSKALTSATTVTSFDSAWKVTRKSNRVSANSAIGVGEGKRYFMGLPVQTVERTVQLACSTKGVLS
ncbi:hypothetical protein ERUR111494_07840 [Erysipelothrix urinaevulpis]|uniref:hypothetical protein n=1 Tax=Erysipelothrix urinaevulpis TaxID=2683717 RepID=UPI00135CEECE|nr:hypothetical protein [Erysipelothrix urinaevulpis]